MISITQTTPTSVTVQAGDKTKKVLGESFARGYGSPDFVIDTESIDAWDPPHAEVLITKEERESITQYLLEELPRRGWVVAVE